MMMLTSSGSNSSSIQLKDSEDLTENYPAGELYTSELSIGMKTPLNLPEMTSHHGCQQIGLFTSRDINTSNHSLQYKFVQ